ncbi:MAG: MOSC domain-containing protein [Thermoplasmata archaeon]
MLGVPTIRWGAFGENLTTSGWLESTAHIGDVMKIGSAKLEVTQPRSPCYKMNAAFGRPDMIERFHHSGRSGFYLAPVAEGEVGEGDPNELLSHAKNAPSIFDDLSMDQPAD